MLDRRVEVLFPSEVYEQLVEVAQRRRSSVGQLIRDAVTERFLTPDLKSRREAADRILASNDDLGDWPQIKELIESRYDD